MPIHIAITRRVRPGSEAEFQKALNEFFQASFGQPGVMGVSLLTPAPGTGSREYGILRTFASETERDAFYDSPMFKQWDERARTLTEGEAVYRPLHGLEAWFRSPHHPPPKWKMAVATFLGVFPLAMLLTLSIGPVIRDWPFVLRNAAFNACVVVLLSWVVMPLITKLLHRWLQPQSQPKGKTP